MQICLLTKCPQKDLKLKDKKINFAELENRFLILTFFRGICHLDFSRCVHLTPRVDF
jgi:hypothetical protein